MNKRPPLATVESCMGCVAFNWLKYETEHKCRLEFELVPNGSRSGISVSSTLRPKLGKCHYTKTLIGLELAKEYRNSKGIETTFKKYTSRQYTIAYNKINGITKPKPKTKTKTSTKKADKVSRKRSSKSTPKKSKGTKKSIKK